MSDTITVKYSCHQCGLHRAEVEVRLRKPNEDVAEWVEMIVGWDVKVDHSMRSPLCSAVSVQDLMIPIEGRSMVGGPVIQ
jgi:hypothetical protein